MVAQDDTNLKAERGLSSFDQRHKLSADGMWELPWGEGRRWMTRPGAARKTLATGWCRPHHRGQRHALHRARGGRAFSDVAGGVNGSLRANYNGEGIQLGDRSWQHWFNTAAFPRPPQAPTATREKHHHRPGQLGLNVILSKNIPLHPRWAERGAARRSRQRPQSSQRLRHQHRNLTSASYGQVTSVGSMRKMMLGAIPLLTTVSTGREGE